MVRWQIIAEDAVHVIHEGSRFQKLRNKLHIA
jgi:hypothetical protein